jgi:hypothetical protein
MCCRATLWSVLTALVAVLFATPALAADTGSSTARIDLRNFGWYRQEQFPPGEFGRYFAHSVVFNSDGVVYVGFPVKLSEGLARREAPNYAFRILAMALDGRILHQLDIGAEKAEENALYSTSGRDILALVDSRIYKLSPELKTEAVLDTNSILSVLGIRKGDYWWIKQSPTYAVTVLSTDDCYAVLDVKTWKLQSCGVSPVGLLDSINDKEALAVDRLRPKLYRWPLYEYQPVATLPVHGAFPQALARGGFLFIPEDKELRVFSSNDEVKWRWRLPKNSFLDTGEISHQPDGGSFAVTLVNTRGGNRFLDISPHEVSRKVMVFRATDGHIIAEVPTIGGWRFCYALDFTGTRLAILSAYRLSIHSLVQSVPR